MRVLVAAAGEPWPLDAGGRLHLHHVLAQLARCADVTLLLPSETRHPEHLPPTLRVVSLPSSGNPDLSETDRQDNEAAQSHGARAFGKSSFPLILTLIRRHFGYRTALAEWLRLHAVPREFDVVMLNGAVMGQHVADVSVPFIWNPQDELILPTLRAAQFSPYAAWLPALKRSLFYALYERYVASRAAATIYVSPLDAAYARRWCGAARLEVVQNGVDFDAFAPRNETPEPGTVVFVGSLEFEPNIDAARHFVATAWPRIHAADARRRLLIVGRRPVPEVRALADAPGVSVIPDVPDVCPYLARAAVVIVPIRTGGGLKNKVLEACAMRRPVVAHPRALAGLSVRSGQDLLSAASAEGWIRCVTRLLDHPEYAERMADNGRAWVARAHSWENTGRRFFEILSAAANTRRRESTRPASRAVASAPSSVARFRSTESVMDESHSWIEPRVKADSNEPISSSASC